MNCRKSFSKANQSARPLLTWRQVCDSGIMSLASWLFPWHPGGVFGIVLNFLHKPRRLYFTSLSSHVIDLRSLNRPLSDYLSGQKNAVSWMRLTLFWPCLAFAGIFTNTNIFKTCMRHVPCQVCHSRSCCHLFFNTIRLAVPFPLPLPRMHINGPFSKNLLRSYRLVSAYKLYHIICYERSIGNYIK